jgi:DNA mismatch repair protein MutS2
VLEALVNAGARVVTTTHYPPLKGLPLVDPRFAVAAMEVRDGKPTYALLADATGESHALSTAERLGLGSELLQRARALLESADRGMTRTLEALEEQRSALAAEEERVRAAREEVERLQAQVERRSQVLQERSAEIEKAGAADFLERLKKAERAIGAVVAQLQANPSHKGATAARQTLDAFRDLTPTTGEDEAVPPAPRAFQVGDRVRHPTLGHGVVDDVGRNVRVRGKAVTYTARPEELELIGAAEPKPAVSAPPPAAVRPPSIELADALRIPGNTVDLRGMRVDEAIDAVEAGLDRAVSDGVEVVFVLHGHGTGALKSAVRDALKGFPVAKRFAPANADQGGDAYTVVAVG